MTDFITGSYLNFPVLSAAILSALAKKLRALLSPNDRGVVRSRAETQQEPSALQGIIGLIRVSHFVRKVVWVGNATSETAIGRLVL